jgi:PilZ domain
LEQQRKQNRIKAAVPVQVSGTDARGDAFEESTDAVEVSRRGLSFLTKRDLPMLGSVTVLVPGRGPSRPGEGSSDFFSEATVVRVLQEDGGFRRVSLRFIGATLLVYASEKC